MKSIFKGGLGLGLLNIGIKLYKATESEKQVKFHQINSETGNKIKYLKVDAVTLKQVPREKIKKAFFVGSDNYVIVEDEELRQLEKEKSNFRLLGFIDDLDYRFLNGVFYYAVPDKLSEENFVLFREILKKINKKIVVKGIMRGKDVYFVIYPAGKVLVFAGIRTLDLIRDEPSDEVKEVEINKEEIKEGAELLKKLLKKADIRKYENEYMKALAELVQEKLRGKRKAKKKEQKKEKKKKTLVAMLKEQIKEG